jgi:DNA-binding LytR/AlgR family response regulator
MKKIRAVIADDEDTLRGNLKEILEKEFPEIDIVGEAGNGIDALHAIKNEEPDVAFLDIKMPGLTGINVANFIEGNTYVVFVTAYNEFAVKAFEVEAVDYLLKPLEFKRLRKTVNRLKEKITNGEFTNQSWPTIIDKINNTFPEARSGRYIRWIKASQQDKVHIVPVDDIRYFKSDNKCTSVVTEHNEWIIRKPIKELEAELDPEVFWRVHRAVIVNASYIVNASRTLNGGYKLRVLGINDTIVVSRAYAHLFKQM